MNKINQSNWKYRKYMQDNATIIINNNTTNATNGIPIVTNKRYTDRASDLKQSFLDKKNIFCPSIIM